MLLCMRINKLFSKDPLIKKHEISIFDQSEISELPAMPRITVANNPLPKREYVTTQTSVPRETASFKVLYIA